MLYTCLANANVCCAFANLFVALCFAEVKALLTFVAI